MTTHDSRPGAGEGRGEGDAINPRSPDRPHRRRLPRRSGHRTLCAAAVGVLLLGAAPSAPAGDEHEHRHAEAEPAEEAAHEFTVAELQRFGVTLVTAAPGPVDVGLELPGEVRPNGDRTAHVAPRFPGTAREVRVAVGDRVRSGDVLAVIESDTMAPFPLRAPLDGQIVDKHVVRGETVGRDTPAFVVVDLSTVWVDISVYQHDLPRVRVGQRVRITAGQHVAEGEGSIGYLSPILDQATRTAVARVVLPNPEGRWRPGLFVTAHVIDPVDAAVTVPRSALQRLGGDTVVFVVDGDHFAPRLVQVGRLGETAAEIAAGVRAGERVAADGSFLVKADLGKSAGDTHAH